jgi:hypothetical protein
MPGALAQPIAKFHCILPTHPFHRPPVGIGLPLQQAGLFALELGGFGVEFRPPKLPRPLLPSRHCPPLGLGDGGLADQEFSQRYLM